jgi:multicomponent K+:H+ antiporter subunit G
VGAILIASAIYFTFKTDVLSLHEVLITMFLFITAPVSAHLMAKAAIHIKLKQIEGTQNEIK